MTQVVMPRHRVAAAASLSTRPVPLISVDGVTCRYGNGPAVLENVSMSVAHGDFTGLVGPSGSGKTTLLRVLLDIIKPVAGTVTIKQSEVTAVATDAPVSVRLANGNRVEGRISAGSNVN